MIVLYLSCSEYISHDEGSLLYLSVQYKTENQEWKIKRRWYDFVNDVNEQNG